MGRLEINSTGHVEVADHNLCHTLYNLTGWDNTCYVWNTGRRRAFVESFTRGTRRAARTGDVQPFCEVKQTRPLAVDGVVEVATIPAYDLSYLLARLPAGQATLQMGRTSPGPDGWQVTCTAGPLTLAATAGLLVDAVASLCIQLAEHGRSDLLAPAVSRG